jgi:alkanesulfonate monooxygenase SsuD/methylene tetrahydromethanopterin reductase-like flavin-dependent oxidoreductase (luciferase family)
VTVRLHWFLPTGGDGRTLVDRHAYGPNRAGAVRGVRPPDIEYLAQIAKAAEQLGFEAVLTPTGTWCEDAWLTTVAPARHTERLKFLVAFRPGVISPTLAAQLAATYQRVTRGRLLLNVVTGGDSAEQRRFDDLDADTIAAAQAALGRSESVGQQRMLALHGGSRDELEIHPNLWAGVGLLRGGAGTALVGSHAEVADLIEEYHSLGVEHFVLSGYPHLEEAYWFGEGVIPELAARGLVEGAEVGSPFLVGSGR